MIWDFILRLFVAGILGAVIGLDREYRAKEAGYRTHFLVSLGSALIMIVSQYGFQQIILEDSVSLDPSRVAARLSVASVSSEPGRSSYRNNSYGASPRLPVSGRRRG